MQHLSVNSAGRKWFHVVWHTHRRRRVFKIPAAARFCERELAKSLRRAGWIVDGVVIDRDRVRVLVRNPAPPDRGLVVRQLLEAATAAVRRALHGAKLPHHLWDERHVWCAVITHAGAAAAVRRHLHERAHATEPHERRELGRLATARDRPNTPEANAPP